MRRFLQTDPIFYSGGLNLYAYVGNDPVNATDPSGLAQRPVDDEVTAFGTRTNYEDFIATSSVGFGFSGESGGSASGIGDQDGEEPVDEIVVQGTRTVIRASVPAFISALIPGIHTSLFAGRGGGRERTPSCLNAPIAYIGNGARFLGEMLSYVGGLGITYGAAFALSSTQLGPWGAPLAKLGWDVATLGAAAGGLGLGLEFGGAALQGIGKSGLRGGYEQSRALLAEELQGAIFQRLGALGKLFDLSSTTGDVLQSVQRGLVPEFSDSVSCSQEEQ